MVEVLIVSLMGLSTRASSKTTVSRGNVSLILTTAILTMEIFKMENLQERVSIHLRKRCYSTMAIGKIVFNMAKDFTIIDLKLSYILCSRKDD